MTEEQILNAITDACEDSSLRFQIIIQDDTLHIYINRPSPDVLDYQQLKSRISRVINRTSNLSFSEAWLYCRVLGEIETDWQSAIEIESNNLDSSQMSSMIDAITDAVDATNSIVDKINHELEIKECFADDPWLDFEELPTTAEDHESEFDLDKLASIDEAVLSLDLHKYCFISNQRLLYAVLVPPEENIARLINTFEQFAAAIKRLQLPILQMYFEKLIIPDLNDFEPEVRIWWVEIIKLESQQQRYLAIWLSRYCLHPEATIAIIKEVLVTPDAIDQQPHNPASSLSEIAPLPSSDQIRGLVNHNLQTKSGLISNLKFMVQRLRKIFSRQT